MPKIQKVLLTAAGLMASHGLQADPLVSQNPSGVAHDQPYYTQDVRNTRLIFTEANKAIAEKAAGVELKLHPIYEQSFGYQMDTRLNVGLMSGYNQIANGFSTQYPRNRQINYIGGALMPDYFASSSWLLTLLAHETAHNYQTNVKDNPISRTLHDILGNGVFLTPIIPAITPNILESSFILEGNAVLNESRHGLGGRLYSGRFRALAYAQANAGYLTKERLYNNTLFFPYGEHFYTLGSYYQYYLAENYGVDKVNKYFKHRSQNWFWPFVVNAPMRETLGRDFIDTMADWDAAMKTQARNMQMASGKILARSQSDAPLNEQNGKIAFLINADGRSRPALLTYHKASGKLDSQSTGHLMGKVFEKDSRFYSVASDNTSVWRIYQGLYDGSSQLLENTKGKIMQGWLPDGRMVYFDTASSFINPQLYVGDEFYASVNSSVLVKGQDIYYCTQDGNKRTLYRNKDALYSFESYYGFPVDVDEEGQVYFIANSSMGSTLFRLNAGKTERVLAADNILDARLAADGSVLVTAISADEYYYSLEDMKPSAEVPYAVRLLWDIADAPVTAAATAASGMTNKENPEDSDASLAATEIAEPQKPAVPPITHIGDAAPLALTLDHDYGLFSNIRYSGTSLVISSEAEGSGDDKKTHTLYDIRVNFEDPLTRSSYNIWASRDEDLSNLAGAGFTNNQFFLLAGVQAYYVLDAGDKLTDAKTPTRDSGIAAELRLPFLDQGYWRAEIASTYFQDYKTLEREPLSLQLNIKRSEQHGQSMLPNREVSLSGYGVKDRSDLITGAQVHFTFGLPKQFYLEAGGKFSASDAGMFGGIYSRGVDVSRSDSAINNDPSRFVIPSLNQSIYAQRASVGEAGITKVFDFSSYHFRFPLSLRREALLLGYRHFNIDDVAGAGNVTIGQSVLGLDLDLLILNVIPITFAFEAVHNNNTQLTDRTAIQGGLALAF